MIDKKEKEGATVIKENDSSKLDDHIEDTSLARFCIGCWISKVSLNG